MANKNIRGNLILFLAALIWGTAFVAQDVGMDHMGPFTFNAARFLLGGLVLLVIALLRRRKTAALRAQTTPESRAVTRRDRLVGGLLCGLAIFVAASLQQFGILYTTVGKSGFITALYVLIVPLLGLLLGKKVSWQVWAGAALALVGLYLLCMGGSSFSLQKGDLLLLGCAFTFSIQMLLVDRFVTRVDPIELSCGQFLVSGLLSAVAALVFEKPDPAGLLAGWLPILYAGILSCSIAYTLQIVGQKTTKPAVASLILCLESVIAALSGWVFLHETLTAREFIGCALMFVAIVLAQIDFAALQKPRPSAGR